MSNRFDTRLMAGGMNLAKSLSDLPTYARVHLGVHAVENPYAEPRDQEEQFVMSPSAFGSRYAPSSAPKESPTSFNDFVGNKPLTGENVLFKKSSVPTRQDHGTAGSPKKFEGNITRRIPTPITIQVMHLDYAKSALRAHSDLVNKEMSKDGSTPRSQLPRPAVRRNILAQDDTAMTQAAFQVEYESRKPVRLRGCGASIERDIDEMHNWQEYGEHRKPALPARKAIDYDKKKMVTRRVTHHEKQSYDGLDQRIVGISPTLRGKIGREGRVVQSQVTTTDSLQMRTPEMAQKRATTARTMTRTPPKRVTEQDSIDYKSQYSAQDRITHGKVQTRTRPTEVKSDIDSGRPSLHSHEVRQSGIVKQKPTPKSQEYTIDSHIENPTEFRSTQLLSFKPRVKPQSVHDTDINHPVESSATVRGKTSLMTSSKQTPVTYEVAELDTISEIKPSSKLVPVKRGEKSPVKFAIDDSHFTTSSITSFSRDMPVFAPRKKYHSSPESQVDSKAPSEVRTREQSTLKQKEKADASSTERLLETPVKTGDVPFRKGFSFPIRVMNVADMSQVEMMENMKATYNT